MQKYEELWYLYIEYGKRNHLIYDQLKIVTKFLDLGTR